MKTCCPINLYQGIILVNFALLSLTSKASELCRTTCGMQALVPNHEICSKFQDYEDKVINTLRANVKDFRHRKAVCHALKDWNVTVHAYSVSDPCKFPSWSDTDEGSKPGDFCIIGHTDYETKTLEVNTYDWVNSTLMHEMVHAIDVKFYGINHGHCDWSKRGIDKALRDLTGIDSSTSTTAEGCK